VRIIINNYKEEIHMHRDYTPFERVAEAAYEVVDRTYSETGSARTDALAELYLPYHNGAHARGAIETVWLLKDVVGLTVVECGVAAASAAAHDVVYELGVTDGTNERLSAEWIVKEMLRYPDDITYVQRSMAALAVLGTSYVKDGFVMQQNAVVQAYPTKRAELVAHVVAAADLGKLYAPDGPLAAHKYYEETVAGASGKTPALDGFLDYQRGQITFLDGGYRYPSKEIEWALSEKKPEVMAYSLSLLDDLEQGRIDTWQGVLDRDTAFMKQAA
jgi:hypothetical protein